MRPKGSLTLKSLMVCLFWNAVLVGVLFFVARHSVAEARHILESTLGGSATSLSEEARQSLEGLMGSIARLQRWMLPALLVLGAAVAFVEAGMIRFLFRRSLGRVSAPAVPAAEEPTELPARRYAQSEPQAAVQILSILQRKGRFIDFLEEDLSLYDDAQIGAAARSVHQGCKDALAEHLTLKPVLDAEEGLEVSVPAGFDPGSIQLIGEVKGAPPFKGILRHRGWCVEHLELPRRTSDENEERILAPAEVEVGG